jgi:hypothetical protein
MREVKVFSAKPVLTAVAAALIGVFTIAGVACAEGEDGAQGLQSSRGGSPWATYYRYLEENPEIYAEADRTYPDGQTGYGKNGETEKKVPGPRIPGKIWPIVTQPHIPQGPEKTMNWAKTMDRITGYSQEPIGSVNLSPGFAALSLGVAGQMLADQLQSPQATMPRAREEQNQQVQLSADNTAAMERQQAGCAIDFVASLQLHGGRREQVEPGPQSPLPSHGSVAAFARCHSCSGEIYRVARFRGARRN